MKQIATICILSLLLLSCSSEQPSASAPSSATTPKQPEPAYSDTQTVYYYEPAVSFLKGTVYKAIQFKPATPGATHKADQEEVYVLKLEHTINLRRMPNTDQLSQNADNITRLMISERNEPMEQYTGKKVQIKGLLMQDPTQAGDYRTRIIPQEVTPW